MNDRETARYDMFGRVETFGKDNTAAFAAGSKGVASTAEEAEGNREVGRWASSTSAASSKPA